MKAKFLHAWHIVHTQISGAGINPSVNFQERCRENACTGQEDEPNHHYSCFQLFSLSAGKSCLGVLQLILLSKQSLADTIYFFLYSFYLTYGWTFKMLICFLQVRKSETQIFLVWDIGAACPRQTLFSNLSDDALSCELKSSTEKFWIEEHKKLYCIWTLPGLGLQRECIIFSEVL